MSSSKLKTNPIFRLAREPFAQFLFIGALIFAGSQLVTALKDRSEHRIVIDRAVVHRIAALYETQMGAPPTANQLDALTDDYIKSEIFYREALRLGLDRRDEIIKRRLVQKLSFLTADADSVASVSEADLKAYYDAHRNDFAVPATVTFKHIFFSADDHDVPKRIVAALAKLRANPEATGLGDPFPLETDYAALSRRSARQIFGDTPIVDGLFDSPTGSWQGPFKSGYGWHLIYVGARTDKTVPPLADIHLAVASAAQAQASKVAAEKAYAAMRAQYRIVRSADLPSVDATSKLASAEAETRR
jgi:peptidyl-prolyl cis-trans isomerase C